MAKITSEMIRDIDDDFFIDMCDLEGEFKIYKTKHDEARQAKFDILGLLEESEEKAYEFVECIGKVVGDDILRLAVEALIDDYKQLRVQLSANLSQGEELAEKFYTTIYSNEETNLRLKKTLARHTGVNGKRYDIIKAIIALTSKITDKLPLTLENRRMKEAVERYRIRKEREALREAKTLAKSEAEAELKSAVVCTPAVPTREERLHGVALAYTDFYEMCTSYMIKAQMLRLKGEIDKAKNIEAKVTTMHEKLFNNDAKKLLVKDENPDYGRKNFSKFIQPYERDEEELIKLNDSALDDEALARVEDKIASAERLKRIVMEAAER